MIANLVRRAALAGLVVATAITVAGCGGTDPAPTAAASTLPAAAPASFGAADVMFAQMMIPHHEQAVTMADLARTRAKAPEVRRLAEKITGAQQPEIDLMTGWLRAAGKPTAAPGADEGHGPGEHAVPGMLSGGDLARLAEASGRRFDRLFLTKMIAHHRGAVTAARAESARGSSPEVKSLAQRVVSGQRAEISTMKQILARL